MEVTLTDFKLKKMKYKHASYLVMLVAGMCQTSQTVVEHDSEVFQKKVLTPVVLVHLMVAPFVVAESFVVA